MYYHGRRNKYGNKKAYYNGLTFDSKHERDIYVKLKAAENCGAIRNLRCQVPYELQPKYTINGRAVRAVKYVADFTFENADGTREVWDAKGVRTDVYKLKKKLFEYKYGLEIKEV